MSPEKLVSRIRSALSGTSGHLEMQSLAREYSDLISRMRDRTEQCATFIRAGNDYAALQIAESFPPLLDTAAKLAFPELHEWHELCRERNVACAPPLEHHEIAMVSELYGKKINETHPLYHDYRKAVRERNDLRALAVLGSIIRVNTQDQNARHEFLRLSAKVRETYLTRLEGLLDANQNDDALALADELENLHLPALANAPALARARELRLAGELAAARAAATQTLANAAAAKASGDWETAATDAARIREILRTQPALELPTDAQIQLHEIEAWTEARREELARHRQREESVAAAEISLQAATAAASATAAARARAISTLENTIATAELFDADGQDPRPSGTLLAAARGRLAELRKAEHKARFRMRLAIATCSAALVAAAAVALPLYQSVRQRDSAAARMENFPRENKLLAAESFEKTLKSSWNSDPAYRKKHEQFREWLQTARRQVDELSAFAANLAAFKPETLPPAPLRQKIAELNERRQGVNALPLDVRASVEAHLETAAANLEKIRAHHAERLVPALTAQIAALKAALDAAEKQAGTAARLAATTALQPKIQALDTEVAAIAHLLSETTLPDWNALKTAATQSRLRWWRDASMDAALLHEDARTLAGHLRALREFAATLPADTTPSFATVLNAETALNDPAAQLLAPEPAILWKTARAIGKTSTPFLPSDPQPEETETASKITATKSAKTLENIYRHTLRPYPITAARRPGTYEYIYSIGPARNERLPIGDGFELRQTVDLYKSGNAPVSTRYDYRHFGKRREGTQLDNSLITPESAALRNFNRFYDATAGRIVEPPLALMERIRTTPSVSVLLKSWLLQELFKLTAERPAEWGILFAPTARNFSNQLRQITNEALPADAWLDLARWGDKVRPLENLYAAQQISWQEEALARLRVFQRLANPGFVKIGHITADGLLRVTSNHALSGWLIGVAPDGTLIRVQAAKVLSPSTHPLYRIVRPRTTFAAHSPILMLDIPPAAAAAALFPKNLPEPNEGWDAWFFQPRPATDAESPAPAKTAPAAAISAPATATTPTAQEPSDL